MDEPLIRPSATFSPRSGEKAIGTSIVEKSFCVSRNRQRGVYSAVSSALDTVRSYRSFATFVIVSANWR